MINSNNAILELKGITYSYRKSFFSKPINVIQDVTLTIPEHCIFAITGIDGSGKSTLAAILSGLLLNYQGEILLNGELLNSRQHKPINQRIRMVYSDQTATNFNYSIIQELALLLRINKPELSEEEIRRKIFRLLGKLAFPLSKFNSPQIDLDSYMSAIGALARALILEPEVLVMDEFLTSIEVGLRIQLINFLLDYRIRNKIIIIMITSDLGLLKHIADYLVVLDKGQVIEQGTSYNVLTEPSTDVMKRAITDFFGKKLDFTNWTFKIK